jgi:aldose 1-epimerase
MGLHEERHLEVRSARGATAVFSRFGAKLLALRLPTADGGSVQVVVGSAGHPDDRGADLSAGAICGRVANRIAHGRFELDGIGHVLPINRPPHTLHGGTIGFSRREWQATRIADGIAFHLRSDDGDMGFPGTLEVDAVYRLEGTTLRLEMTAVTDRATPVNLTNHAYFNLAGHGSALGHELEVPASRHTPVDAEQIPTGEIVEVAGGRADFRQRRVIGEPYDVNLCLDAGRGPLHLAARLFEPVTGRRMEVHTTEPALQLYTANHFSDAVLSPWSTVVVNGGIALEPQTHPNAINHPSFPSCVLRPGETHRHHIEWRFFV